MQTSTSLIPFLFFLSQNKTIGNTLWSVWRLLSRDTPDTHAPQEALKSHWNHCVMPQQEASAEKHVHAPGCSSQQKEPLSPGGFRRTVPESTRIDSSSARKQDGIGKNRPGCSYLLCTSDLHLGGTAYQRDLAFKKSIILKTSRYFIGDMESIFCRQLKYTKHSKVLPPNHFQARDLMVAVSRAKVLL